MPRHADNSATGAGSRPERQPHDDVDVWIFDLDNTLYPPSCNLFSQVDERMGRFISDLLGVDLGAARELQKRYYREHGTTLAGLMANHGIAPDAFLAYVHDIDVSGVAPSPELGDAIARLPGRKIVYTNGSVRHAENIMGRLGIADHFCGIFDIAAADFRPKPNPAPYDKLVRSFWFDPRRALMVEDIARNLEPAHALGMTTVWIENAHRWSQDCREAGYVDHVIGDLATWLGTVAPVR